MSTVVLNENTPSIKYLCQKDKRLAKVISTIGEISYTTHSENPYAFMIHEIIEQMLSIKALTGSVLVGNINFSEFSTMSDSEVNDKLTSIKGIGKWTAKMYLIFVLDRQNILPTEDAAFLQSYCWLYKVENPTKKDIIRKCAKWSPYSSIAARYLYRALDLGLIKQEFHLYK